jgi:phosphonate transport system permease protein
MSGAAEIAAFKARMPAAFGASPLRKAVRITIALMALAWLVSVLVWFDLTPARIWAGIGGLGKVVRLMIPPSPGAQWADILNGLAQSVAMAFLGTFLAMIVAVPLGFLGARNVVVNVLAHFTIRRGFDALRGMDQLIWALAFVRAVGLGPLAGVMAITAAEIAVLANCSPRRSRTPIPASPRRSPPSAATPCCACASACCRKWRR